MKYLTWNLEWSSPKSKRLPIIQQMIADEDPDVVCYTEVIRTVLPEGYIIEADADYGYSKTGDRRKVILWSKTPWTEVDVLGGAKMPTGRFVSGVTGGVRFAGVCIPWRDAHVRTGRRDRSSWEDHISYCKELQEVLRSYSSRDQPICILGDYNQRIPRFRQPIKVFNALMEAIPNDFNIVTKGLSDSEGHALIDHISTTPSLQPTIMKILPRFTEDGTRLSDHVGILGQLKTVKMENKAQ
ncbi:endonuclease/exonuclease/phosphatase family protein [Akkermansiaceae bacterium]|nr:endonuclease/exonuclease/phosphatase family protein [Akkermansiaceae bacterium]